MGAIVNGIGYWNLPSLGSDLCGLRGLHARIGSLVGSYQPADFSHLDPGLGGGRGGWSHSPTGETASGLRVIPNLDVIRPADPEETAGAFVAALQRTDGPTGLILTRQNLSNLSMKLPVGTAERNSQRRLRGSAGTR